MNREQGTGKEDIEGYIFSLGTLIPEKTTE